MNDEKKCSKCGGSKPQVYFYPKGKTGKLSSQCKRCENNRRAVNSRKKKLRDGPRCLVEAKLKRERGKTGLQTIKQTKRQKRDAFERSIFRRLSQISSRIAVDPWDEKITALLSANRHRKAMRDGLRKANSAMFLMNTTGSGRYECRWIEACLIQLKRMSLKQMRDVWLNKIRNTLSNQRKRLRKKQVSISRQEEGFVSD